MGPLQGKIGDDRPHPGERGVSRCGATKETFEEHHNASLMWQTFLRRLRPGVFASQNQKDLVSLDSSNLFVFLDAYFCAKKGSLVALASLVFIILLWGQAPAFRL